MIQAPDIGEVVLWTDPKAKGLFDALRNGQPIPR